MKSTRYKNTSLITQFINPNQIKQTKKDLDAFVLSWWRSVAKTIFFHIDWLSIFFLSSYLFLFTLTLTITGLNYEKPLAGWATFDVCSVECCSLGLDRVNAMDTPPPRYHTYTNIFKTTIKNTLKYIPPLLNISINIDTFIKISLIYKIP